jgi:F0F1-type ATP synthase membrane subunit b/b'
MDFKTISDFLDLVRNPDKYEAAIKAIEEKEASLKATIADISSLNNIAQLEAKAREAIEMAKVEAAKLVEDAKSQAAVIMRNASRLHDDANTLMKQAQELEQRSKEAKAHYDLRVKELAAVEKANTKLSKELDAKSAEFAAKEIEIADRLAKLRQVMS